MKGDLMRKVRSLKPQMAAAAQRVYNRWHPDDYGGGGICDDVASAMSGVIAMRVAGVEVDVGGWAGDHAFVQVWNDEEALNVDIPPGVYETGGGYSWEKIEGVRISSRDVFVDSIPLSYVKAVTDSALKRALIRAIRRRIQAW